MSDRTKIRLKILIFLSVVTLCLTGPTLWFGPCHRMVVWTAYYSSTAATAEHIGRCLSAYAADNDGFLPHRFSTESDLQLATKGCAEDKTFDEPTFFAEGDWLPNPELAGKKWPDENTRLLFESKYARGFRVEVWTDLKARKGYETK